MSEISMEDFEDELDELESAEDFLNYFKIPFEQKVVHVNRLHILQRFHNYLSAAEMPDDVAGQRAIYVKLLSHAYEDFVNSDAQTEKVLRIFQKQSGLGFVSLEQLGSKAG